MNSDYTTLPATARVWVYMADRELTSAETAGLQEAAGRFVLGWAAHGKDLQATAEVRYNRFLILLVDEQAGMASGCSIDSSVHFVKEAGKSLGVDFFNRMLVAYRGGDDLIRTCTISEVPDLLASGTLTAESKVFNNLVSDKHSLDVQWETTLQQSPYKRWL